MGILSCLCGAAYDTVKQEAPQAIKQVLMKHIRAAVRGNTPHPSSPWLTKRIVSQLNSVDDRVSNMPPEWRGWTKTNRVVVFHDANKAGCFEYNTPIQMSNGDTKYICDIEPDDFVQTPYGARKVTKVFYNGITKDWLKISCGDTKVVCTPNHKFFVRNVGWVPIIYLEGYNIEVYKDGTLRVPKTEENRLRSISSKITSGEVAQINGYEVATRKIQNGWMDNKADSRIYRMLSSTSPIPSGGNWYKTKTKQVAGCFSTTRKKTQATLPTINRRELATRKVRSGRDECVGYREIIRKFKTNSFKCFKEIWYQNTCDAIRRQTNHTGYRENEWRKQSTLERGSIQRESCRVFRKQLSEIEIEQKFKKRTRPQMRMLWRVKQRKTHRNASYNTISILEKSRTGKPDTFMHDLPLQSRSNIFGTSRGILRIEKLPRVAKGRYDIEVEDVHCYYANGFLVHNCHLEWYLNWKGQYYNVGVKRLSAEMAKNIKYNSRGEITQATRAYLIELLKDEFDGEGRGSFVGQSTDHKEDEAKQSWINYEYNEGYGAGRSRTVLADDDIVVWKMGETIEGRDHLIDPTRDFYIHRPFEKTLKVGLKNNEPPNLEDRLHLKPFIGRESWEKFRRKLDNGIMTIKHDGASAYFEMGPKGLRMWSPRVSKTTGRQIEYTHKVGDLRHTTNKYKVVGMGELLFKRDGKYLKAHEIGGVLNSNSPLPDDLEPEFVIYRVDKVDRTKVIDEPYNMNMARIYSIAGRHKYLSAPKQVSGDAAVKASEEHEGLVGIPQGASIKDGMKYKPRGDEMDVVITAVKFHPGPSGKIAGTLEYIEETSGKRHNISSGFTEAEKTDMMNNPDDYIDRVMKLEHYQGHTSRAAKFKSFHDGK